MNLKDVNAINNLVKMGAQSNSFINGELDPKSNLLTDEIDIELFMSLGQDLEKHIGQSENRVAIRKYIDYVSPIVSSVSNAIAYPYVVLDRSVCLIDSLSGFAKTPLNKVFHQPKENLLAVRSGSICLELVFQGEIQFEIKLEKGDMAYLPSNHNFVITSDIGCSVLCFRAKRAESDELFNQFSAYIKEKKKGFTYFYASPENLNFEKSGMITRKMINGWRDAFKGYFDKYYQIWLVKTITQQVEPVDNSPIIKNLITKHAGEQKGFFIFPGSRIKFLDLSENSLLLGVNGEALVVEELTVEAKSRVKQLCSTIGIVDSSQDIPPEVFECLEKSNVGIRV